MPGGRHCGWERAGSAAGAGLTLAERGGVGSRGDGEGFPVALSGVATAAGNAHFVRSWVPKDRHPMGAVEGCGPQVRELGLRGAGIMASGPITTWQIDGETMETVTDFTLGGLLNYCRW